LYPKRRDDHLRCTKHPDGQRETRSRLTPARCDFCQINRVRHTQRKKVHTALR
jgi:hypothetical protein